MLHLNDKSETGGPEIFPPLPFAYMTSKVCQSICDCVLYMCVPSGICVHESLDINNSLKKIFFIKHIEKTKPGKLSQKTEGGESLKLCQ